MDEIIDCLSRMYFSQLEAQIYLTLVENGELSGYQIAKRIGISRSSVYAALEPMFERGIVLRLSENVQCFTAQDPTVLFAALKAEYSQNADQAAVRLQRRFEARCEERFTNIKGLEGVVATARELLMGAKREVYLNTDFDLHLFADEFTSLRAAGVRIIVFSFADLDTTGLDIEYYTHHDPGCADEMPSRLMLVTDCAATLVADTYKERGTWLGTVTNNALMVSIMAEHIHHDIYLLKLRDALGREPVDATIQLGTMLERGER